MDKLNAMRSFVEVAACGSFTAAAEQLGQSRLRVSRDVQELEDWLQLRLLHRTTRRVSLTTAGEEALRYCERILSEAAELESRARLHTAELVGDIRIASPIGLGQNLLLDLIDSFSAQHPQVRFYMLLSDKNAQLVDERVDIALRYTVQPDDSLIARRLMAVDSMLCASPDYLARYGKPATPAELTTHNCLIHLMQQRWQFLHDGQLLEQEVNGNLFANDMGVLVRAACKGMGIARLPCDLGNPLLASGALQPLLEAYPLPQHALWAVYLSRSYQQPVIRAFIDFAAQYWQQDVLRP